MTSPGFLCRQAEDHTRLGAGMAVRRPAAGGAGRAGDVRRVVARGDLVYRAVLHAVMVWNTLRARMRPLGNLPEQLTTEVGYSAQECEADDYSTVTVMQFGGS